jgi:ABC-2 type transport system permease protein
MTTDIRQRAASTSEIPSISIRRRLFGLGTVFGKTLRDSRRAMLLVGGFLVLMWLIICSATATTFGTAETRQEGVQLTRTLPSIFLGLYGGAAPHVETLGGLANWRYGLIFLLLPAVWSLIALSGTLVVEARRGSLEFVAATHLPRRRIAIEKVAGHLAAMTIVLVAIGAVTWLCGQVFKTLPGDEIPIEAAFSYALYMGLIALATGAIAFALAPLAGRGAGAGIAAAYLFGSWVINGYRDSIPVFHDLLPLSMFSWTINHKPIAAVYDWPSLIPLVVITVVGFVAGVVAFERRDLGAIGSVRLPSRPRSLLGIGGPLTRSAAERLSTAVAWGIGLGVYGLAIGSSAEQLRKSFTDTPAIAELIRQAFPNLDPNAPGFGLQIGFLSFGYLAIGIAAITLLIGWASDETEGRLDLLLAAPVARARWLIQSGLGVFVAIVVAVVINGVGIGLGIASTGADPVTPAIGTGVLALYAMAIAGVGLAAGGLLRSSMAGIVAGLVVVGMFLLDILVPALKLPDEVHELALSAHYGEPMLGHWDPVGIVASLVLAFGGLLVGAWGFARRDLKI